MGRASALIAIVVAAGCESGGGVRVDGAAVETSDAPVVDASIDADLINWYVEGRYLDWDSTDAAPCPIVGATWTVRYDGTRVSTTDATGAFSMKLASYLADIDVEQPAAASACTIPSSTYTMPAAALVPAVIHYAGGAPAMRAMTMARATTFYSAIGSTFDATRGQLFVHIDGPSRGVSISSAHAAVQAFDGSLWAPGATGVDVFFPNIDLSSSVWTTVSVAGGAVGTGSVVLVAGTMIYMTVITN